MFILVPVFRKYWTRGRQKCSESIGNGTEGGGEGTGTCGRCLKDVKGSCGTKK